MSLYRRRMMERFQRLFVRFTDPVVEQYAISKWDIDGDGLISQKEAALVTSIGTIPDGATSFYEWAQFPKTDGNIEFPSTMLHAIVPDRFTRLGIDCTVNFGSMIPEHLDKVITVEYMGNIKQVGFRGIGGYYGQVYYDTNLMRKAVLVFPNTPVPPELVGIQNFGTGFYYKAVYVPDESVRAYQAAFAWGGFTIKPISTYYDVDYKRINE